jgi:hypothetical protein
MSRAEPPVKLSPQGAQAERDLPVAATHDPEIEGLVREQENARKQRIAPPPAPRPAARREPFGYD